MLPEIPKGYKLDSIKLYPDTKIGKSNYVYAQYVNDKGKTLSFETRNLFEDGGYTVGTDEKTGCCDWEKGNYLGTGQPAAFYSL